MSRAEIYREQARRCERQLEQVDDLRIRRQLRRERQEWLDLASSREAAERRAFADAPPLDEEMTLAALRAFEARRAKSAGGKG